MLAFRSNCGMTSGDFSIFRLPQILTSQTDRRCYENGPYLLWVIGCISAFLIISGYFWYQSIQLRQMRCDMRCAEVPTRAQKLAIQRRPVVAEVVSSSHDGHIMSVGMQDVASFCGFVMMNLYGTPNFIGYRIIMFPYVPIAVKIVILCPPIFGKHPYGRSVATAYLGWWMAQ